MSMKLPFLQESKWPTANEPEERVVNPSHDRQLQDHLMDELLSAMEHKNPQGKREALMALVRSILTEDPGAHDEM